MRWTGRVGAVLAAAFGFAGVASASDPTASLPPGWSHAAINVVGPKGQAHTVIYDKGKVTSVGPQTVTLKELDSSSVTIAVATNASVKLNGQTVALSKIQPGSSATTMGVDGAPATQVQATSPPVMTRAKVVPVVPTPKLQPPRPGKAAASTSR